MVAPILYLTFPGNAREALEFYAAVFGGEVQLHTYAAFSRTEHPNSMGTSFAPMTNVMVHSPHRRLSVRPVRVNTG
jgi:uncharacterized glyoxalase superfamily protein PhnB